MPKKMSKPEETAAAFKGAIERGHDTTAGPTREQSDHNDGESGKTDGDGATRDNPVSSGEDGGRKNGDASCLFTVTPFPERISRICGIGKSPYTLWILLSLIMAGMRISAMIVCGEETGRFPINIVYSLLPGGLAILTIYYTKQTEKVARTFCKLFNRENRKVIESESSAYISKVFSNRAMIITGIFFTLAFLGLLKTPRLFPTPVHNIQHRAAVRDRITVNVGLTRHGEVPVGESSTANDKPAVWGWVRLPLGKVISLASEMEKNKELGITGKDWYKLLTDPPQETYESHLPNPNHDEELGWVEPQTRQAIDPNWERFFPSKDDLQSEGRGMTDQKKPYDPMPVTEIESLKAKRVKSLPPILRDYYRSSTVEQRWAYSQWTYLMVIVPLLFMSGAMLWCVGAIIAVTWKIGREPENGEINRFALMDLTFYPHPGESVGAVGDLLWQIAFITGSIYSLIMICQFFAYPDTMTLIIAGMFSPLIVALFIVPQYNLHKLMVKAKYRKINALDTALANALEGIEETLGTRDTSLTGEKIGKAQSLLQLQKTMSETNDWPCDLKSLAMIISSVIIPIFMALFTLYEHFK
ncbi:MAG: hypothetical protein AB7D39_06945 [Pseudodesulfovibrio sp.]|uniref:hypothetical protein n=1 Tax=Pseudodesulfovibrio sp. TaxID=2035812 RepID=UPI003D0F965C